MINPALRLLLLPLVAFACLSEPVERWVRGVFEFGAGADNTTFELQPFETAEVRSLYGGAFVEVMIQRPEKPEGPQIRMSKVGDSVVGPARVWIGGSQNGGVAVVRVFPATNTTTVHLTLEVATNSPAAFIRAR